MMIASLVFLFVLLVSARSFSFNPKEDTKTDFDANVRKSRGPGGGRGPRPNGLNGTLYDTERILAQKEFERLRTMIPALKTNQQYEIHGFYHTSTWRGYWSDIIKEQLMILDGYRKFPNPHNDKISNDTDYAGYRWDHFRRYASLLEISDRLFLNVAIDKENTESFQKIQTLVNSLELKHANKIVFHYNHTIGRDAFNQANDDMKKQYSANLQLSTGEYSTIDIMQKFCQAKVAEKKKVLVYYFHSKGSCCMKDTNNLKKQVPVAAWREYMNAMNLEFPSICIRAIANKKYIACGVENQDAHFSGNFWWSECDHIARLPSIENRFDFMAPEYFVLRTSNDFQIAKKFGYRCGYSMHNCGLNLYDFECSRVKFRDKLSKHINFKLGGSNLNPQDTKLSTCREAFIQNKPYYEQQELLQRLMD
jgi:hypothetical protein